MSVLEPNAEMVMRDMESTASGSLSMEQENNVWLYSIAISIKRIADALDHGEGSTIQELLTHIANAQVNR